MQSKRTRMLAATLAAALGLAACGKQTAPQTAIPTVEPTVTPTLAAKSENLTVVKPDPAMGDGGVSPFYDPQGPAPAKPGTLIRAEPLASDLSLARAGEAYRILYSSTDGMAGKATVAVSGALFLPKGKAPAAGWPLIAWAHGTVGIADVCAPSWNKRSERDSDYLNHWLSQGYAVVASDYQGLGAPGGHPYLATRPEAYSVLDAIRAVQGEVRYALSSKVVLVGQSQGAGAAFATAGEAPLYAPEIDIRGTVATGTPYFTTNSSPTDRDPNAVEGVFAYTLYILHTVKQAEPAFDMDAYLSDAAKPTMELTRTACLGAVWESILKEKLSQAKAFKQDPTAVVARYYPLLAYASLKTRGPVFMGVGSKDHDVPPEGQRRLSEDACKAGAVIERHVYPALDHSGTVNGSLKDSTPFVKKAFAGEKIAGNCAKS
jgi:pimeloyl-ACP methyl ester carboxylesterase